MKILAPREGIEPPTYWLTASRSAAELSGNIQELFDKSINWTTSKSELNRMLHLTI